MIIRRNRNGRSQPKQPKLIVRRTKSAAHRPRMIVRRGAAVGALREGGRNWARPHVAMPRVHLRWPFRKAHLVLAGSFVAAASLALGVAWVLRSPLVQVNHLQVAGNQRIPTESIVEQAHLLGANMLTADLVAAQHDLYAFPLIASVSVERKWPNTVKITVEERKAWGTWEQSGAKYTIDRDGVVLGTMAPPAGSPVIRSAELTSLRQGDRVNYQAVDAVAEIYERLPRQLGTTVTEVAFVAGKGVQVTTADGQVALLGDSSAIAYKLAVWAAAATEAQRQRIGYTSIDLRYGNRPVLQ